jgi:uncharacterized protein (UPF0303 family)
VTDEAQALIASLQQQQRDLQFAHFDNDDAWALGVRFVEVAQLRGLPIVIDIRRFGQQLFHAALPGTTAENDSWVERKIRVVNRFSDSFRTSASTPSTSQPTVALFRSPLSGSASSER